jgi:hypothetical protein
MLQTERHTDTFAARGSRDPRQVQPILPADMADAWSRASLNEAAFGDPSRASEYGVFAALAVAA